ncbi:MAG TPA: MurR/RpiR family transcriptional regulator [Firmicutes bacterium]|nr:MurR/RpiR family transcriptional regulator [Bacillota bacterium]
MASVSGAGALARIRGLYPNLAPAEQKIADYVLDNPEDVIYATVTQLAERCGVGEATVIRFCQSAGFRGYQELKLSIARDLVSPLANINEEIAPDDTLAAITQKISISSLRAINETLKVLDLDSLDRTISLMLKAKKIQFCGVGASGLTALEAKYRFLRIGVWCEAYLDAHFAAMFAATLGSRDVVIGFSHTGSTKDTVHCLEVAKGAGAHTVCITNHPRSPITKVAEITLLTSSPETPLGSGAFRSKMAQLLILDVLFTGVAMRMQKSALQASEKTAKAVLDKLY